MQRPPRSPPADVQEEIWLGRDPLDIRRVDLFARARPDGGEGPAPRVRLSPEAHERVRKARECVDRVAAGSLAVYGVNTGFGHLAYVRVGSEQVAALQENLVRSHAIAVGPPLSAEEGRAVLLLRANSLSRGHSGVRPELVEHLCGMLNAGVAPAIPSWGSVGASGDLAPLAHLALAVMGEGMAYLHGELVPAAEALGRAGLSPVRLSAKEGLALINGTEVTTALGALALSDLDRLALTAEAACALTIEALAGSVEPFDPRLMELRPHPEAGRVAANLRSLLAGSPRLRRPGEGPPQDAYSLRATPAIQGAARELMRWAAQAVTIEMQSVVDNPVVFPADGEVVSGANFHAQPVAGALDAAAMGAATLANAIERRIERLVNPHLNAGLPPFLTRKSGLASGLMMAQYVAASLTADCRLMAQPASIHSIPTSAGQEDVVSMGAASAAKLCACAGRLARVVALELICAAQAAEVRGEALGPAGAAVARYVRSRVPAVDQEDRSLSAAVEGLAGSVVRGEIVSVVERVLGTGRLAGFLV